MLNQDQLAAILAAADQRSLPRYYVVYTDDWDHGAYLEQQFELAGYKTFQDGPCFLLVDPK